MSITKVLSDEKMSAEEKLSSVAEVIAGAREAYGNTEADIASPKVSTVHGAMSFDMLEADSKVQLLRNAAGVIKARAVEAAEQNPGVNINKKIEELLATDPMFTNIDACVKFEYL